MRLSMILIMLFRNTLFPVYSSYIRLILDFEWPNPVSFEQVQEFENVNWHECAAFQRSAFGRLTAGNDVVATIFISLFFFPQFPPPLFSRFFFYVATFSQRRSARIKKLI